MVVIIYGIVIGGFDCGTFSSAISSIKSFTVVTKNNDIVDAQRCTSLADVRDQFAHTQEWDKGRHGRWFFTAQVVCHFQHAVMAVVFSASVRNI